jgi:hypothetical protein
MQNGTMIARLWLGKMFISHLSIDIVSQVRKKELWKAMKDKYIYPTEVLDRAEKDTLYTMGRVLRTFRCNLNKDFAKNGLTPFNDFDFVTPDDGTTFVN